MPKFVDHATRRREIVYALWVVIHQQGIAAASLRTVASEAGVSIGRIQHYFPNKEELVREGCREMVAVAVSANPSTEDGDPHELLMSLACHAIPTSENGRIAVSVWHAYLGHVGADPVIAKIVRDATTGGQNALACLLARVRGHDQPYQRDAADALALAALSDGLMARVLAGAVSSEDAVTALQEQVRFLTAGTR